MVIILKEFHSAIEIVNAVDHEITETKNTLNGYLRRLEDIRALAEKSKKIREIVSKFAGKRAISDIAEISIGGINLVLDAKSIHEVSAVEEVVRSQQEKLSALQRAREGLRWADQIGETEGVKFLVLERNEVPEKILLRFASDLNIT